MYINSHSSFICNIQNITKYSSIGELINKSWSTHTMNYSLAVKNNNNNKKLLMNPLIDIGEYQNNYAG